MPIVNVKRFSRDKRIEAPAVAAATAAEDTVNTSVVPVEASQDDDFSCLGRAAYEKELADAAEQVHRLADEKERQKALKEQERERLAEEKRQRAASKKCAVVSKRKTAVDDDTDSVFNDTGTEIIGKERRIYLQKIVQYKHLFPNELKTFKVKRNATIDELKLYIDEMSSIVEIGTLDEFISDSILHTIKLAEGVTSYTQNYNVTGLSDMLKYNPQFSRLVKTLYIKYNTFESVPPEYQLGLLVATTSYVCINKNRSKGQMAAYLNSPHTS